MICDKCGREIIGKGNNNYNQHYKCCDGNPIPKRNRRKLGIILECNKCGRKIKGKGNYNQHYDHCDGNPIPKLKRNIGWTSKGKTYIEIYGDKRAKEIIEKIKNNNSFSKHSEESKKNISLHMMGNKNWENSVTKSGRGRKGHYKGLYFMSTWELAFIVYSMEHNIEFKRNWEKFEYLDVKGNKRYYIPDFIVENIYIEIKGYMTEEVELKINSFKLPLIVIGKKDIKPIIDYVKEKYGENFYEILKDK